jgi:hypothetical protein
VFPNRLLTAVEDGRLQIRARAEHPPVARLHDAFDAVVDVEERVGEFQLAGHSHGEGIVVLGAVEGHEDDGRHFGGGFGDVGDFDLGEGEVGVVLGEGEFGRVCWWVEAAGHGEDCSVGAGGIAFAPSERAVTKSTTRRRWRRGSNVGRSIHCQKCIVDVHARHLETLHDRKLQYMNTAALSAMTTRRGVKSRANLGQALDTYSTASHDAGLAFL